MEKICALLKEHGFMEVKKPGKNRPLVEALKPLGFRIYGSGINHPGIGRITPGSVEYAFRSKTGVKSNVGLEEKLDSLAMQLSGKQGEVQVITRTLYDRGLRTFHVIVLREPK